MGHWSPLGPAGADEVAQQVKMEADEGQERLSHRWVGKRRVEGCGPRMLAEGEIRNRAGYRKSAGGGERAGDEVDRQG